MLVDRRAVSQYEVSRRPFDFHGAAGTHGCGAGRHWGEDRGVRLRDDSTAEAPKNKKRNLEMANRDNLAEFHDELRDPPFLDKAQSAQKLSHLNLSNLQCVEDPPNR